MNPTNHFPTRRSPANRFPAALSSALIGLSFAAAVAGAAPAPSYHLVRTISLLGAEGWDYLAVDSAMHRLYVSRGTHVSVVDTSTGQALGDIPDTSGVHGVAVDPKSGHGFTSNGRSNSVTIFDLKTLKKIDEVTVGEGTDAIIFEPTTERVFTFNGEAQSATAIDGATGKVIGTVPLPGRPEFPVADGKGHIYDNIEDKSEIADVNASTLKVDNVWPIAPGDGPSGIAMDKKNRRLFSVCGNQIMTVTNADTGKVVATPAIGNGPDAAAFDPGSSLAFSPNGRDGTITVLQQVTPDQYQTVQTITTQPGARTMILDEQTHHLFTCTAKTAPPAPGAPQEGRRRRYLPGTFVVLEYAP